MSQAAAIVIAALIAVSGYLVNHALGRWAERKRSEERAVADLAAAAMSIQSTSRFRRAFADGPLWRQIFAGWPPAMPKEVATKVMERGFGKLDEMVRAHGELLHHARADLIDAATEVLDASLGITDAWDSQDGDDTASAAERMLGQARLRLYRASRGSRSRRWRLGRPALFDNIDESP